jgi:hypothetical protein
MIFDYFYIGLFKFKKKMTLREKQSIFALNVAKLIKYAYEHGYEVTLGEAYRTKDQQLLYFEGFKLLKVGRELKLTKDCPKSKTMNSRHLNKLAIDLNVFKDGIYLTESKLFSKLAKYWTSLNADNVSGYDWGWDFNHFEMKP